ncbi:MAG: InlB B-repeat-containing protein [Clostridia bacterium]|nr:InlB B-repeat-containing protein [Clostridia bacterium]
MKKLISLLLAMLMVASILPMQLFAAEPENNTQVNDAPNTAKTNNGSAPILLANTPTDTQSSSMENQNQASGIIYTKTSTAKTDGTVEITLTAHTMGEVKQTTTVSPTDIVLVLDVSGSMKDDYTSYTIESYSAVTGSDYVAFAWSQGFYTGYGFDSSNTTYYINLGTDAEPKYTGLLYTGRDSSGYEMYEYYLGNDTIKVYPVLDDTYDDNREHSYNVVQFYEANINEAEINKMTELKEAVNSFIDATAAANKGLDASQMHTISIVKFADDSYYNSSNLLAEGNHKGADGNSSYNYSELVKNLTVVDDSGAAALKTAVSNLTHGGATAVDYGLNIAEAVLKNRAQVTGESAVDRKEVIIVFTDGVPTYGSSFDNDVANNAITTAGNMKTQAGVKIYSVCIADGANPVGNENINLFMHYVSSNFPNATSMTSAGTDGGKGNGYYMTPSSGMSLSMIFESILSNIDHPTVKLGEEATLVDTLSPYFDFANGNLTNVSFAITPKTASGWGTPVPVTDGSIAYSIDGDRVTVTGFDFDANFVSAQGRGDNGDFYGKRLEICFTVKPDYAAIDAAGVSVTNGSLPTNTIASLIDSESSEVAQIETPILATHQLTYMVDGAEYKVFDRLTGSDVSVLEAPTRVGYTFSGWSYPTDITVDADGKFVMPDKDVTISATFIANKYEVTYAYAGDVPGNAPALPETKKYEYGETVTVAPNVNVAGYTFNGWESLSTTAKAGETFAMPDHPVAFVGEFDANSDTGYKVEYYLENLAGDGFDLSAENSYSGKATTGTEAVAVIKEITGFTFDEDNGNNLVKGIVTGDGNLTLKLYYTRNSYPVTYAYDGEQHSTAPALPTDEKSPYKYGATVTVKDPLTHEGYVFVGWYASNTDVEISGNTFTMPAIEGGVTLLGRFEPASGTPWKEEHYFMDTAGNYPTTPEYSYNHTGVTGQTASAVAVIREGFTLDTDEDNVTSATIAPDGSTTLKFYYERNKYKVTYTFEGTVPDASLTPPAELSNIYYGEEITVENTPSYPGYSFNGWFAQQGGVPSSGTFTMPDNDVEFKGSFVASTATPYKVVHHIEKAGVVGTPTLTDFDVHEEHIHYGTTGETATATVLSIPGFRFDDSITGTKVSGEITAPTMQELHLYYVRNTHTVTYSYEGTQPQGADAVLPTDGNSYKYGATVDIADDPSLTGYEFKGWYTSGHITVKETDEEFTMPDRDVILYGSFEPKTNTKYKEVHLLENLGGGYENAEVYFERIHYGKTGASVSAARMTPTGFTFDTGAANVESATIAANGSTTLVFHYKRASYKVSYVYDPADGQPDGSAALLPATVEYKYGKEVRVEGIPSLAGYTFNGWIAQHSGVPNSGTFTMPAYNVVFEGTFNPNTDTKYEVHHHLQKLDGTYPQVPDFVNEHKGTTGKEVVAVPRNFTGYHLASISEVKGIVKGDGSLVLDLFYDRNKHQVTYTFEGKVPDENLEAPLPLSDVFYGAEITVEDTPSIPGFTFEGWTTTDVTVTGGKFTMPDNDVAFVGKFNSNLVKYKVNYYFQKLDAGDVFDPDEYELSPSSYERDAYTGQYVQVDDLPHDGFHINQDHSVGHGNVTVDANGNGNLVLNIYFDRNVFNVTYEYYGNNPTNAPDLSGKNLTGVRYGTTVEIAAKPTLSGYTFEGWLTHTADVADGKFVMPNHDVKFLGLFEKKTSPPGGGTTTKYTLTYVSNGGTEYEKEKYEKGTEVTLDKVPVKEGYVFTGWYSDSKLGTKIEKVTMSANKTVYAGWNSTVPDALDGEHHIAYVIGYPNDTVRPLEHITRAEVTAILFRLLKEEVREENLTEENSYTDVEEGAWYNKAISTLTKMGIVHGRTETEFMPDEDITRAEFATFCARFDDTVVEFKDDFSDVEGHWAEAYIHEAAARGWVKGYEDGTFRPEQSITRAEAMALINRVLCRIPENTSSLLDGMITWPDNADTSAWYYLDVQEATNSHTFEYIGETGLEKWLKLTENPDWMEYHD